MLATRSIIRVDIYWNATRCCYTGIYCKFDRCFVARCAYSDSRPCRPSFAMLTTERINAASLPPAATPHHLSLLTTLASPAAGQGAEQCTVTTDDRTDAGCRETGSVAAACYRAAVCDIGGIDSAAHANSQPSHAARPDLASPIATAGHRPKRKVVRRRGSEEEERQEAEQGLRARWPVRCGAADRARCADTGTALEREQVVVSHRSAAQRGRDGRRRADRSWRFGERRGVPLSSTSQHSSQIHG